MELQDNKLKLFSLAFHEDNKNLLARNAVTSSNLLSIVINRDKAQQQNRIFSKKIKVKTKPSNQNLSGRCWLFALCNMLRISMIKRYKLPEEFELSAAYLAFFDKLERSNFFLSQVIKYRKEAVNSRMNYMIMNEPISDGGNWNMILNIVNKYGVIPKSCFHESYHSNNTSEIDAFLNTKLRDYAYLIRNLTFIEFASIDKYLENMMSEIYRILVIFMGQPPKQIVWEYMSKENYKVIKDISPRNFYKKIVPINLDNYVLLADNPILPYGTHFTVNNFNNMKDGREIAYINVGIGIIKSAIRQSIDAQEAIWFGCDVGKYLNKSIGVLDVGLFNYRSVFNTDVRLNKKNRLIYKNSDVTHAMIIRGYDNLTQRFDDCKNDAKVDDLTKGTKTSKKTSQKTSKKTSQKTSQKGGGVKKTTKTKKRTKSPRKERKDTKGKPVKKEQKIRCLKNKIMIKSAPVSKYLVENSWGQHPANDENLVMTEPYLSEYVYIVAVDKRHVHQKIAAIQKKTPTRLELWDPFGYLLF